jgi:hypothetical protein
LQECCAVNGITSSSSGPLGSRSRGSTGGCLSLRSALPGNFIGQSRLTQQQRRGQGGGGEGTAFEHAVAEH